MHVGITFLNEKTKIWLTPSLTENSDCFVSACQILKLKNGSTQHITVVQAFQKMYKTYITF